MRILIVEDESSLREQLSRGLRGRGYIVDAVADGNEGLYYATQYPVDLAVVDLGLPGMSGMDVIKRLREEGKTFPVLILTARSQWQDKVEGLAVGGDDYMVKPFHMEEFYARIAALIRRSGGWAHDAITAGPIVLDLKTQIVTVHGKIIDLTAYEYKVLEYLILHPKQIVSKTTLTEHIYEQDFDKDSNVIEVFVARLRKKLDPENEYNPIETLRGRGYRFMLGQERE